MNSNNKREMEIFQEKDTASNITDYLIKYALESHHVSVQGSADGHDQKPDCLVLEDKQTKWCLDFNQDQTWVEFSFKRPIHLRGYGITVGNDEPNRDPVKWEVEMNNHTSLIQSFVQNSVQLELQEASDSVVPERHSHQIYTLKQPIWTDKVKFIFRKTRSDDQPLIQISHIGFYA